MTPFERQFARLFGGAAAPAQFVAQEQRSRQAVAALADPVGQGVLQVPSVLDRLLGVPLVEASANAAMNSVLQHMAQAQTQASGQNGPAAIAPQLARALAPLAPRTPVGLAQPGLGHAVARTLPPVALKAASGSTKRVNKPLAPNALQDGLDQVVQHFKTAAVAQQAWQQRTARAGLAQAFATPLQMGGAALGAALNAPGLATVLGPTPGQAAAGLAAFTAAPRQPGRAAPRTTNQATITPTNQGPVDALVSAFQPVLPLLRATLDQFTGRGAPAARGAGQAASTPAPQRRHAGIGAALLPELATPLIQAGQAVATALQATAPVAPFAAALPGAVVQGLRGLAARAQQAQAPHPSQPPQPPAPMQTNARSHGARGDDEALAQQLTRVLKREAARDGIDISDVQP